MKRVILGLTAIGVMLSASLWAHHAAEGIVSDEIWDEIDANLEAVSSPHLAIDFDDPGCLASLYNCMGTDLDTIDDSLYMVTTVEVYLLTPEAQADPDSAIETYFDEAYTNALDVTSRIPSGALGDDTSTVFYVHVTNVGDEVNSIYEYAVIDLYEPIGSGRSQDDIVTDVAAPNPGKGPGGG